MKLFFLFSGMADVAGSVQRFSLFVSPVYSLLRSVVVGFEEQKYLVTFIIV